MTNNELLEFTAQTYTAYVKNTLMITARLIGERNKTADYIELSEKSYDIILKSVRSMVGKAIEHLSRGNATEAKSILDDVVEITGYKTDTTNMKKTLKSVKNDIETLRSGVAIAKAIPEAARRNKTFSKYGKEINSLNSAISFTAKCVTDVDFEQIEPVEELIERFRSIYK